MRIMGLLLVAACASDEGSLDTGELGDTGLSETEPSRSPGCGLSVSQHGAAVVQIDAELSGDGVRSYTLVMPEGYDPDTAHNLVIGYAGTNWTGEQIRPYLDLERHATQPTIFVYPDPLWRDFDGWGTLGGWVLGDNAYPADGLGDLVFTERVIDHLAQTTCIDPERIFTTGHSWGGDMSMVASCLLGDRVRASVPVAANRPYWFDDGTDWVDCPGDSAVWTFFGIADDHFTWQDYPGQFGEECVDFWLEEASCDGWDAATALPYGESDDCVLFEGCDRDIRYCEYAASFGHQVPDYFATAAMSWFESFE